MKIKVKVKDFQLTVRAKLSSGSIINDQELDFFLKKSLQGFLKPNAVRHNVIDFTGPVGSPLYDRLSKPINKYDFFFIIEQIANAAQKLQKNHFMWSKVVWDSKYAYMNEATKEIRFIYLPLMDVNQPMGEIRKFVESIIYSAQPVGEHDTDFVSRFSYFFRSLNEFDPDKVEGFIQKEAHSVIDTIKGHSADSIINDDGGTDEPTGLLNDDGATGILESDDAPTGLLSADDDTGIMNDAGTDDGSIKNSAHYPSLFRVLTQETIQIDKPVFRLGKERSYVDYFIASNNAVSRSHADVLTRGSRFFVIDLNSTNKTYINGNPLLAQCETEIYDGDRLTLGNEEFVFNSRE